eukprot:scaffold473_cov157-Skeletonema_marinoi.AAC.2
MGGSMQRFTTTKNSISSKESHDYFEVQASLKLEPIRSKERVLNSTIAPVQNLQLFKKLDPRRRATMGHKVGIATLELSTAENSVYDFYLPSLNCPFLFVVN